MTILLNNIYDAIESEVIDEFQAMYIIYLHNDMSYPIDADDLFSLTKLGFVKGNKVGKVLLTEESINDKDVKGTIKPSYINTISNEIPKKLCRLLCVKDQETNKIKLPGSEDTIKHTADKYLSKEGLIAYHYVIFLFMFPIEGETNKKWEKHFFGHKYTGMKLRTRSKSSGKVFLRVAKNKDMGAFLYGTYLFIKSSIKENKTYIKTITNYLSEYDDWYEIALEEIKKAKSIDDLFKVGIKKEGRLTVAL